MVKGSRDKESGQLDGKRMGIEGRSETHVKLTCDLACELMPKSWSHNRGVSLAVKHLL